MENILFKDLKISKEILKAIEKMGFEETTPIQSQSITTILEGKDVIGQAPTGTGKTCAYGIPIIENIDIHNENIQALILCPTRELVIQIAEELSTVAQYKHLIKILPIYGGQQIERQIMSLKKRPQIVVATPGRMMDHLRRKTAKIGELKIVVLDEADEMLNMGFREDIDIILETVPQQKQMVLFSATMPKEIIAIANKYQKDAVTVKVTHKELTIPSIDQYYVEVKGRNKADVLTRFIDQYQYKLCLIFCNTKKMVDELTSILMTRGYLAEALHGDMRQMQRDKVMSRFRKGTIEFLVATDVAARGIDVEDIEAVFNYDVPSDEEYYVHRIGRTGRANKKGISYTFATPRDMFALREIMRYTKAVIHPIKAPTFSDTQDTKVKSHLANVKEILENDDITRYVGYIEKMLMENEENDITTLDIAAAFLKLTIGDKSNNSVSFQNEENEKATAQFGMLRLFINIGRMDKMDKGKIIELIAANTSIRGSEIGTIDIFDKFSFIELPSEKVDDAIISLNKVKVHNRKVNIEIANKKK